MKTDLEKLKDYVTRNEAYIESSTWLTSQILLVSRDLDIYMDSGDLPTSYNSIDDLVSHANELDRRCSVEDKILKQLVAEQNEFLS
tara:strand:- start:155 stop:412 length:258 start_codon:yes stop_codon:yes gene_type:complete